MECLIFAKNYHVNRLNWTNCQLATQCIRCSISAFFHTGFSSTRFFPFNSRETLLFHQRTVLLCTNTHTHTIHGYFTPRGAYCRNFHLFISIFSFFSIFSCVRIVTLIPFHTRAESINKNNNNDDDEKKEPKWWWNQFETGSCRWATSATCFRSIVCVSLSFFVELFDWNPRRVSRTPNNVADKKVVVLNRCVFISI